MKSQKVDFDIASVEILNGSKFDKTQCARFKSHPKDKDKRKTYTSYINYF